MVGTEICDTPVQADNLPVTSVKYHGVDPLGRAFMYVRMHNVSRQLGHRNEGGENHTFPVLIQPRNRPVWNLTPRAFGRRSNWLQTKRQQRLLFHPETLYPTTDTLVHEAKPWSGRKASRSSFHRFEPLLRPPGYPRNAYLGDLTLDGYIRALAVASTRTHWWQPLVLRDPWTIHSELAPAGSAEAPDREGELGSEEPIPAPRQARNSWRAFLGQNNCFFQTIHQDGSS